ncbi:Hypothetical protein AA314_02442 [Archangium gephyra]|uniref:Uncharacterized protein n=1 Tax=Archangium gephyra TaxID=48 RepID=A0AAC8Q5C0_9BACT|nr:Hypothetical protein AA314_02442 [Archangium gephyra]
MGMGQGLVGQPAIEEIHQDLVRQAIGCTRPVVVGAGWMHRVERLRRFRGLEDALGRPLMA